MASVCPVHWMNIMQMGRPPATYTPNAPIYLAVLSLAGAVVIACILYQARRRK